MCSSLHLQLTDNWLSLITQSKSSYYVDWMSLRMLPVGVLEYKMYHHPHNNSVFMANILFRLSDYYSDYQEKKRVLSCDEAVSWRCLLCSQLFKLECGVFFLICNFNWAWKIITVMWYIYIYIIIIYYLEEIFIDFQNINSEHTHGMNLKSVNTLISEW